MLRVGSTFLAPTPEYETEHLYIIISIISSNTEALFVNITTKKAGKDTACILRPGDHSFIRHDSIINYGDAKIALISKLKEAISMKVFTKLEPVSDDILKKIQEGALISSAFPQKFLKYLTKI